MHHWYIAPENGIRSVSVTSELKLHSLQPLNDLLGTLNGIFVPQIFSCFVLVKLLVKHFQQVIPTSAYIALQYSKVTINFTLHSNFRHIKSASHIILDEIHERDLMTDFLMIIIKALLPRRYVIFLSQRCEELFLYFVFLIYSWIFYSFILIVINAMLVLCIFHLSGNYSFTV